MKFPVYGVRSFISKEEKYGLILIRTYFATYIFDDTRLKEEYPEYVERRLRIKEQLPKYKEILEDYCQIKGLYPIRRKFDNLIQLYWENKIHRRNMFVTEDGNIVKYKPRKLVKIKWVRPKYIKNRDNKHFSAIVKGEPYPFTVQYPHKFLALATFANSRVILDIAEELSEEELKGKQYAWRKL